MDYRYKALQPFLAYLQYEKRYSHHTIIAYQTDLLNFFDFLFLTFGETSLDQITHSYVRSWLVSLKDKDISAKSLTRKISTLKSFFKYQIKLGLLKQSPMLKVVTPKIEKRLPNFVSENDLKTLFEHVEFPATWKGQTERLIIFVFYYTGIRLSEAIGLKNTGVNYENDTLKVLGKGAKERIIPLASELRKEMEAYAIAKKKKFLDNTPDVFFLTEQGKPLGPKFVYNSVKHYLSLITTIEKRSPHILRHSFATHLTNNGADLNAVKELLGHSSLAATQVYMHNTIDRLKNVHNKAHPKA